MKLSCACLSKLSQCLPPSPDVCILLICFALYNLFLSFTFSFPYFCRGEGRMKLSCACLSKLSQCLPPSPDVCILLICFALYNLFLSFTFSFPYFCRGEGRMKLSCACLSKLSQCRSHTESPRRHSIESWETQSLATYHGKISAQKTNFLVRK